MSFLRLFGLSLALSAPLALSFNPAVAQAPPQLDAPRVVPSGQAISLPTTSTERARVQLLDASGIVLDEARVRASNGALSLQIEAPPGRYSLQVVGDDKERTPLGAAVSILVPGVRREAGRWLVNGSPIVFEGGSRALPLELRRGEGKLPRDFSLPSPDVKWNDLPLQITRAGDLLPAPFGAADVTRVRASLDAKKSATQTARVLEVETAVPELAARQIEALADRFDAVLLDFGASVSTEELWPLKVARRVAEEQKEYDLPIWVRVQQPTKAEALELLSAGATGLIVRERPREIDEALNRASWLLSEAVTLEDAGVLSASGDEIAAQLRAGGRMPLLARLPATERERREDGLLRLDDATTSQALERLVESVKRGATIYVEGFPSRALWPKWAELTGTQIAETPTENTFLTLSDPWFWGTANNSNLPVVRSVTVTAPKSMAAQTREKRGLAVEAQPRALAGLGALDSNGVLLVPIGSGRLIWMPHAFAPTASNAEKTPFYAALAGTMGAALVETALAEDNATPVRAHLRASKSGVLLLSLFGAPNQKVQVQTRGAAKFAQNLADGKTFAPIVRGNKSSFEVTLASDGTAWIALAADEDEWEKARRESRVKAQIKGR